jgi:molecular chaperone GrpE
MIFTQESKQWDRENQGPQDPGTDNQAHAEEVSLDSPCTEACTHPEHKRPEVQEESFKEKWMRAIADGENLRRRLEKEKKDGIDYALFRFGKEIIGIADQLSWAVGSVSSHDVQQNEGLYQGVSMTLGELERVFVQFGILKINALHQMFDPHMHQVIQEQEDTTFEPGTIVNILQNGYKMHDRLLRPAMVVVVKAPVTPSDQQDDRGAVDQKDV